ncbi:MAG: NADH-quinone oxidoreductase subunit A [Archaeoglobi archaeon]|jgi:NADH-quinone oxidoreductase subunit A|nr:NADH-quinone oxidoreductase subunit A [Archaeoglobus sp.]TDA28283.1 MAG: NADH-quinone oxidoreductase subunit A [Archaeoglobi archaeon]TDA29058.1 MAG: NADH-quinone oxidoreductase subunit A [Archaeoglobi archaeon]
MIESALVIAVIVAVALITDLAILILIKILPKYRPTEVKLQRFEAGNIPVGIPKWTLPMQYLGFVIIFMCFEPVVVLLLLISALPLLESYLLTLIAFVLLLPALYVGFNYSLEIAGFRR